MPTPRVTVQVPVSMETLAKWEEATRAAHKSGELKGPFLSTWIRNRVEECLARSASAEANEVPNAE